MFQMLSSILRPRSFTRLSVLRQLRFAHDGMKLALENANSSTASSNIKEPSFLENISIYFDRAAALTDYSPALLQQVKTVNCMLEISFPVRLAEVTYVMHSFS